MRVEFFGAAGEVTGSCHLVHAADSRVLLDCGMVQGGREEYKRNSAPFGFDPTRLDAVVLSHAHIDHLGRLPLLARRGYRGPIYTHAATADLARIMLEDAAHLAASDAERETRLRQRRGLKPIAPWFDLADVARVLKQFVPLDYGEERGILPGVRIRLNDAGHIVGSAITELWAEEESGPRKLVFSGDLGPNGTPYLPDPIRISEADLVLMESTYGDRLHRSRAATVDELGDIFHDAARNGGVVMIPAFAVGRSQEILYWMARHYDDWGLARFQIALDSPMAAKVIEVYRRHENLLKPGALGGLRHGVSPFHMPNLKVIADETGSRALNQVRGGLVVIAGSGMCNGGRIRHHLKHHLWQDRSHVVIVGYQAQGTLGRQLVERRPMVRIFGESIKVAAQIHTIGGLSAHADQAGLTDWYSGFGKHPPLALVHGEEAARAALAQKLEAGFGVRASLVRAGDSLTP
jgi:metallo-beta-lactamase family protein